MKALLGMKCRRYHCSFSRRAKKGFYVISTDALGVCMCVFKFSVCDRSCAFWLRVLFVHCDTETILFYFLHVQENSFKPWPTCWLPSPSRSLQRATRQKSPWVTSSPPQPSGTATVQDKQKKRFQVKTSKNLRIEFFGSTLIYTLRCEMLIVYCRPNIFSKNQTR